MIWTLVQVHCANHCALVLLNIYIIFTDTCLESEFKCTNERCIDAGYMCDHDDDCGDDSDEQLCAEYNQGNMFGSTSCTLIVRNAGMDIRAYKGAMLCVYSLMCLYFFGLNYIMDDAFSHTL